MSVTTTRIPDKSTRPPDVTKLSGYSGDVTKFLRDDATFVVPPGGGAGSGMNLDYLGDFVAGPVYNDGDIVIGADGIAYMCVVDGTVTPPDPWPGLGMVTTVGPPGPPGPQGIQGPPGPASDATYWLVSPHASLPNARPLNSLGNGYVKSTVGVPSVVATIPLTDTSGILPDNRLTSNVALKNINNNFVAQVFSVYSSFVGANAVVTFLDTTGPVNQQAWRTVQYGNGNLHFEGMHDVNGIEVQFSFTRVGGLYAVNFHGGGSNLTNLHAPNIATGIVNPARLGTGTANSSTFLRGDSTWQSISGIPSGIIVLSVSPCPVGWTRVNWDGLFIRVGPSPTAQGGAATHNHDPGSYSTPNHNHGNVSISGNTGSDGNHSHSFNDDFSGITGSNNDVGFNVDAGGSGMMARDNHNHNFSGNVNGTTSSDGNHSHSFSGSGATGNSGALGITGNSGQASSLPPYIDVFLCQKD